MLVDKPVHKSKGHFALADRKVQILDSSDSTMNPIHSGMSMLSESLFSRRSGEIFPQQEQFIDCIGREEFAGIH